jgi:hypothetical protein
MEVVTRPRNTSTRSPRRVTTQPDQSVAGAALLARLDQMHFEGSLSEEEAAARPELYRALYAADEGIQRLLCDDDGLQDVLEIEGDGEFPWLGRARRLLRHEYTVLRRG